MGPPPAPPGPMGFGGPVTGLGPLPRNFSNVRKHTCRFDVGIENDEKFQVARRIIGSKGANMKRIVKVSNAKLRLRGQGSGFLEGTTQQESNEPLHLCISCRDYPPYAHAVKLVEDLLTNIYSEYQRYCMENNMPMPAVRINMRENPLLYDDNVSPGGSGKRGSLFDYGSPMAWGMKGKGKGKEKGKGPGKGYDQPPPGTNIEDFPSEQEILILIDKRNQARRVCNFKEADRIRDGLRDRGIALLDDPGARGKGQEVTTWRYWR